MNSWRIVILKPKSAGTVSSSGDASAHGGLEERLLSNPSFSTTLSLIHSLVPVGKGIQSSKEPRQLILCKKGVCFLFCFLIKNILPREDKAVVTPDSR